MLVRVGPLPDDALDAAGAFYVREVPALRQSGSQVITCVFPPASHDHSGWRRAAIQSLAREIAPRRINAVASDDDAAIAAATAYLSSADGMTGQYLPLDGEGAGKVV